MTTRRRGILITDAALLALGGGGAAIAGAAGGESEEREDGGSEAAEQVRDPASAERPALEAVGGGKVSEVERGDDGQSGYEVESDRRDGTREDRPRRSRRRLRLERRG